MHVYLFLTGMMLLAELARQQGLFDWLAARAAVLARGSATRLFTLVFVVGTVVTVFLSPELWVFHGINALIGFGGRGLI